MGGYGNGGGGDDVSVRQLMVLSCCGGFKGFFPSGDDWVFVVWCCIPCGDSDAVCGGVAVVGYEGNDNAVVGCSDSSSRGKNRRME